MATKLNDLRKRIYLNLKEKAYGLEGEVTEELKSYRSSQEKNSKRLFTLQILRNLRSL